MSHPCSRPLRPFARPGLRLPGRRWSLRGTGSFSRLSGQNRPGSPRVCPYVPDSDLISGSCAAERQFPVLSRNRRFKPGNRACSLLLPVQFVKLTGGGSSARNWQAKCPWPRLAGDFRLSEPVTFTRAGNGARRKSPRISAAGPPMTGAGRCRGTSRGSGAPAAHRRGWSAGDRVRGRPAG